MEKTLDALTVDKSKERISMLKLAKRFNGLVLSIAAGLAMASIVYANSQAPLDTIQQTSVTSTRSGIVVIFIPGFPLASILSGVSLGLFVLLVLRFRRSARKLQRSRGV